MLNFIIGLTQNRLTILIAICFSKMLHDGFAEGVKSYKLKEKCMRAKPVYLNLFTLKFPINAIVSILHRISGIILFFAIPLFLTQLDVLLNFPERFSSVRNHLLSNTLMKSMIWGVLVLFAYHFFAGIRHLIMDAGFFENKRSVTISSYIIFILTVISSILMGYALC